MRSHEPDVSNRYAKQVFRTACLTLLASSFLTSFSHSSMAAEAKGEMSKQPLVEEIVVTARKREENLQRTPIAITAFSSKGLEARNLTDLMGVANAAPNVDIRSSNAGSGSSSNSQITIRGVGQLDFLIATDPGVGTYVDGVYFARSMGGVMDLLDLERLEILRGPQGTLYGKNTIGGAINLISRKPTGDFNGYAEVTTGSYKRLDARASVDFPIVQDKLAAIVSVSSKDRDGYGHRTTDGAGLGSENSTAARAAIRWHASQDITVDLAVDVTRKRQSSVVTTLTAINPNAPVLNLYNAVSFLSGGVNPPYVPTIPADPFVSGGSGPNRDDLDAWGVSNTIDWKLGNFALKSITAYRHLVAGFGRDGDNSPVPYLETQNDVRQHQFSQEFQFSGVNLDNRLKWVAGAYYFNEHATDFTRTKLASGLYQGLEALPGPMIPLAPGVFAGGAGNPVNAAFDLDFLINSAITIKDYAAFLHATYNLTDQLGLTLGGRYTYEKKDYFIDDLRANSGVPVVNNVNVSDHWNSFSPKAGLEFQATDTTLTYASVSRGFKSGGFNGRPTTSAAEVQPYNPEFLTAYEVGVKSELFDHQLRLNLAGFYYDYKDIQLTVSTATPDGNFVALTENAGKAHSKGVEAEFQATPVTGLLLEGAVGYIDAKYTDVGTAQNITTGSKFVNTPKWTANGAISYSFDLAGAGALTLRGDWNYRGQYFVNPQNDAAMSQKGFSLFNARVTFESPDKRWTLALFGTNLADKKYINNGVGTLDSFGLAEAYFGRPREWGAMFKSRF
jgi:iron complex outermembrane receptor protein